MKRIHLRKGGRSFCRYSARPSTQIRALAFQGFSDAPEATRCVECQAAFVAFCDLVRRAALGGAENPHHPFTDAAAEERCTRKLNALLRKRVPVDAAEIGIPYYPQDNAQGVSPFSPPSDAEMSDTAGAVGAPRGKWMGAPNTYTPTQIREWNVAAQIDGKWLPARPYGFHGLVLRMRLRAALLVFTGRADVLRWEGGQ